MSITQHPRWRRWTSLVDDEIKDDLHATVMAALHERFTVGQGAVWFVDVAVVGDVVALEARRDVKGRRERESAPSTFASTSWEARYTGIPNPETSLTIHTLSTTPENPRHRSFRRNQGRGTLVVLAEALPDGRRLSQQRPRRHLIAPAYAESWPPAFPVSIKSAKKPP